MFHSEQSGCTHSSKRPLFARAPLLGLALAAAGGLLFGVLALNVRRKSRLLHWDEVTCQAIHERAVRHSSLGVAWMQIIAALGRECALIVTVLLGIYLIIQRRWRHLVMLFVGVIGGNTWFVLLSRIFNRQRPVFPDPLHAVKGPGFPSGHSLTGVTLYGLIFYLLLPRLRNLRWRVVAGMDIGLIILLIGYSRLYLGDHYPADVLGGYGFGLFWGALTYTAIELYDARRRS